MKRQSSNARQIRRRAALVAASGAMVGCIAAPRVSANLAEVQPAAPEPLAAPAVAPVQPAVQAAPAPSPSPTLIDLGIEGLVQPFWAGEGDRILFYDQPAAGQGGTWRIDPA